MADKNYIAANIARLRLNQQLTQEEFARRAGLVRQALELANLVNNEPTKQSVLSDHTPDKRHHVNRIIIGKNRGFALLLMIRTYTCCECRCLARPVLVCGYSRLR